MAVVRHATSETSICLDCLLPFQRAVGSRRVLCPACAGHTDLLRLRCGPAKTDGDEAETQSRN